MPQRIAKRPVFWNKKNRKLLKKCFSKNMDDAATAAAITKQTGRKITPRTIASRRLVEGLRRSQPFKHRKEKPEAGKPRAKPPQQVEKEQIRRLREQNLTPVDKIQRVLGIDLHERNGNYFLNGRIVSLHVLAREANKLIEDEHKKILICQFSTCK